MPAKPQALVRYEQTIKLGIPLRTGGIYNQPYVFMLEWAICDQMKTIFDAVESATSG